VTSGRPRLVVAHPEIIGALRRRDREAAREWIRRHMEDWRKGFLRTGNELDRPIDWSDLQAG
jgi:DNA-binding GntR family transcriptional regulator